MTSFHTHRARVHDARRAPQQRFAALRTCVTCFAPYGFRATYHHLTVSARIPRRLEADPDALVRAVEELHEARTLWLARAEEFEAQRRAQKRAGRRSVPAPRPWWLRGYESSADEAWYEDPFRHPALRLPDYVRRQNALLDGAELPGCPACGDEGAAVAVPTGHGTAEVCPACSLVLRPCDACGRRHRTLVPSAPRAWRGIWRRSHLTDEGTPSPHWPRRP